jgi:hypothetical protein
MVGVIDNYCKFEARVVARFLQAEGVSRSGNHRRSVSVYAQNVFSRKEVSVWCTRFKDGRMTLNDDPEKHRGRLRTLRTGENCVTVEGLIRE